MARAHEPFEAVLRLHGCTLSPRGLVLPKNLAFNNWLALGLALGQRHEQWQWALGDWWIHGDAQKSYGARKAAVEAEDWNGPSFQTCMNAASVCRAFPTSRRREVLSFAHHEAVAALRPEDAHALLKLCVRNRWPVHRLRDEKHRRDLKTWSARESHQPAGAVHVITAAPRQEPAAPQPVLTNADLRVVPAPWPTKRAEFTPTSLLISAIMVATDRAAAVVRGPSVSQAEFAKITAALEELRQKLNQIPRPAAIKMRGKQPATLEW